MPYLSRISLNPLRTGAQRMLSNPHVTHAAVLGGLSRQPVDERVLWRLEAKHHRVEMLVLTNSTPSWEHIVEKAGWTHADDPQILVRDYAPLLAMVERGREFAFRLRANPVRATKTLATVGQQEPDSARAERSSRGRRVAHTTVAHQLDWLTSRIEGWGFEIPVGSAGAPDVALVGRETLRFRRTPNSTDRVTLSTATFEGRARVIDAEVARSRLLLGVGSARAYGCGLITLAPLASGVN